MAVSGTEKVSATTSEETKAGSVDNNKDGAKGKSLTSPNTNKSSSIESPDIDKDDETESDE
jgi:hypothetical protein